MSADNYTECPKCKKKNMELLNSLYGKIPADEYIKKRKELDIGKMDFREDWEIGIKNGQFIVSYLGRCGTCNFEFSYEDTCKIE